MDLESISDLSLTEKPLIGIALFIVTMSLLLLRIFRDVPDTWMSIETKIKRNVTILGSLSIRKLQAGAARSVTVLYNVAAIYEYGPIGGDYPNAKRLDIILSCTRSHTGFKLMEYFSQAVMIFVFGVVAVLLVMKDSARLPGVLQWYLIGGAAILADKLGLGFGHQFFPELSV